MFRWLTRGLLTASMLLACNEGGFSGAPSASKSGKAASEKKTPVEQPEKAGKQAVPTPATEPDDVDTANAKEPLPADDGVKAKPGTLTLEGDVKNAIDKTYLPGATAEIVAFAAAQSVSDANGRFRFADLGPGKLQIKVSAAGFISDTAAKAPKPARAPSTLARPIRDAVIARDGCRCTFSTHDGNRCISRRYLEVDHIQPRSCGGTDDPLNLRTLCSSHHGMFTAATFGDFRKRSPAAGRC